MSVAAASAAVIDPEIRGGQPKRKEIYTYQAPWLIYGMNWSVRADQRFRLAIGSFEEECVPFAAPPVSHTSGTDE